MSIGELIQSMLFRMEGDDEGGPIPRKATKTNIRNMKMISSVVLPT